MAADLRASCRPEPSKRAASAPGGEAVVRLPLASEGQAIAPLKAPLPGTEPARVLIVEDEGDMREMLRLALELSGHQVAVAETGWEAIERAAHLQPEVMVVDIGLPDVDGHEVARRVRESLGPSIFLIALTGYGCPEDVRRSERAGFDVHLLKPVSVDDLPRLLALRGSPDHPAPVNEADRARPT